MLDIDSTVDTDNIHLVSLAGEFDLFEKARVDQLFAGMMKEEPSGVIVDLSAISFIDSSGVGVLIAYYAKLKEKGVGLALVFNGNDHVMRRLGRLLALTDPTLKFYGNLEEAKKDLKR